MAVSCGDPTAIKTGPPAQLDIVSGDAQSGVVGKQLGQPLVVRVKDANGNTIAGQLVNFKVTKGGGSMFAGSALSRSDGVAQDLWTLGPSPTDSQVVEVRAVDQTTGAGIVFAVFHATPINRTPAAIAIAGGNGQTATVKTALPVPPSVKVTDAEGVPVSGITVTFAAATGSGSITGASTTTNSGGIATVGNWTLAQGSGTNYLTAIATGVSGSTTIIATGTASVPKSINSISPFTQSAVVGTAVASPPIIQVTDIFGNGVPGVRVIWSVDAGSIGSPDQRTDSLGLARVASWTLPTLVGNSVVRAEARDSNNQVIGGNVGSVGFSATGTPGPASKIAIFAGDQQTAVAGNSVSVAPSVQVTDQYGNGIAGVTVTWVVTSGGGTVTPRTNITAASSTTNRVTTPPGIATVSSWTLGTSLGSNTLEARVTGLAPGQFAATGLPQFTARAVSPLDVSSRPMGICTLDLAGAPYCWSAGYPKTPTRTTWSGTFEALALGSVAGHECALTSTGAAHCWGTNSSGELGNGGTTSTSVAQAVQGGLQFTQLAVGSAATCGLTAGGSIYCWGGNSSGQIGDGTVTFRSAPTLVSSSVIFTSVTAGLQHTCALAADSTAYCWGSTINGQAGGSSTASQACANGLSSCLLVPTQVPGGLHFALLSAGFQHTCGLTAAGEIYCWGSQSPFSSGTLSSPTPTKLTTSQSFASITAGAFHTCAATAAGAAYCVGTNTDGQLGLGFISLSGDSRTTTMTAVVGGITFKSISAGYFQTCGIDSRDGLWCWGRYPFGLESGGSSGTPRPLAKP